MSELMAVLTADRLNVRREEEVLNAIMTWLTADSGDRTGAGPPPFFDQFFACLFVPFFLILHAPFLFFLDGFVQVKKNKTY